MLGRTGTRPSLVGDVIGAGCRTQDFPLGVAMGDLNGDARPDLAVANSNAPYVSVLINNGDGTFQGQVTYPTGPAAGGPSSVAFGDLNGDGRLDLAVANAQVNMPSNAVSVLFGNGDGTMQPRAMYATGSQPAAVAIADVNEDGRPDLVVANEGSDDISVLLNGCMP
jgi:FG-GAP-like repeat